MNAPAIHIKGSAAFGAEPVFGPLEIDLPAASWTCLLGPSGVGKTTLLRLVAGFNQGIAFDGSITASDGLPVAPRSVLMQQSEMLLPWATALQNVTIGARLRGQKVDGELARRRLNEVGLDGFEQRFPNSLSGGQRQRVVLARTMMEDRPIVLLDEPFSALDVRTRAHMQELALQLFAGKTVLFVTHDVAEAVRLANTVAVMADNEMQLHAGPVAQRPRNLQDPETLAFASKLTHALMQAAA